ncbi:MAG: hypothetical protein Q8K58_07605 [Acidimicrobiales bacterium]|nr:hypothetical protein [Acidimicrobiales bacterium]
MSERRPAVLALVVWTLLVWTTRIGNIWGDDGLDAADKVGRTALALSFTVLAAAVAAGMWRRAPWTRAAVRALAGWTTAVWVVRAVGIATGDHSAAFVVVHLVLTAVSIGLAALAALAVRGVAGRPSGFPMASSRR